MKTNLGTSLTRSEMKNLQGGKYLDQMACICTGTTHHGDATICGFNTLQGAINCTNMSLEYCGRAMNCSVGDGPA